MTVYALCSTRKSFTEFSVEYLMELNEAAVGLDDFSGESTRKQTRTPEKSNAHILYKHRHTHTPTHTHKHTHIHPIAPHLKGLSASSCQSAGQIVIIDMQAVFIMI